MASNIARRSGNIGWARSLLILGAVVLLMLAFAASVALSSLHHVIDRAGSRFAQDVGDTLGIYRLVPAATLVRHLLRPVLRADAGALPQARLPQMAGRAAHHRLVAGDGRAPARRARPVRRLQPDLRQPRRRDDRADLLLRRRPRRGDRRRAQRGAGGKRRHGAKGRNLYRAVHRRARGRGAAARRGRRSRCCKERGPQL